MLNSYRHILNKDFLKTLISNQEFWKVTITGLGYGSLSVFYLSYSGSISNGVPVQRNAYLALLFALLLFPFPIATTFGIFISSRRLKLTLFFLILLASFLGSIMSLFMYFLILPLAFAIAAFLLIRRLSIGNYLKIVISVIIGILGSIIVAVFIGLLETVVALIRPPMLAKLFELFSPLVIVNFFFLALAGFTIGAGVLFSLLKSPKLNKWVLLFGAITAVLFEVLVLKFKLIIGQTAGLFFLFGIWAELWASLLGAIIALGYNAKEPISKESQKALA